jgi:IS605 OrfB family transposase
LPHVAAIDDVLITYKIGLQLCVDTAWTLGISNNIKLHPHIYAELRKTLPAQLAIGCIKQSCGIVKKARSKPIINRASVRYNFDRSARVFSDAGNFFLSLRVLDSRITLPIEIPNCFLQYFAFWQVREGLLVADKRGNHWFYFTFQRETILNPRQGSTIGIDLGIRHTAVTSTARFYTSKDANRVNRKYAYLRRTLQAKRTRGSKRLLKAVSGREERFRAWRNHNIAKQIVSDCVNSNITEIVLEDLTNIRKAAGKQRKVHGWSFSQLSSFLSYKAERVGILIRYVNPFMTSQLCAVCGCEGIRYHGKFSCAACGIDNISADWNAARNIAHPMLGLRQAAVNRPNSTSSGHSCSP